jgi:hypothetical protein
MDGRRPDWPASLAAAIIGSDLYSFIRASFLIISGGPQFLPNWHMPSTIRSSRKTRIQKVRANP